MLKRSLTKVETILLLVLVAALMGLLYYQFLYKPQQEEIKKYDTAQVEQEIQAEQVKAMQLKEMRDEIEQGKKSESGAVEPYDNIKKEINELNDIFGEAPEFSFSFDKAVADGNAVRRRINSTFKAENYKSAKEMLQKLHDCAYRCQIQDVIVKDNGRDRNLNYGGVGVEIKVTFFETLYGATTTDGLEIVNQSSTDDPDLLDKLAASKTELENM